MALENKLDKGTALTKITNWLNARLEGASDLIVSNVSIPQASGLSAETIMFTASWRQDNQSITRDLVARIKPSGEGLFLDYDLRMEFQILQALDNTDVPSPSPFLLEIDPKYLGSPFFVMERVDGRVAPDDPPFTVEGWVLDLSKNQREAMASRSLEALVALHNEDVVALGLQDIGHGDKSKAGLDRLLEYWETFSKWACGEPNPIIEAGIKWLNENKPSDLGQMVLSWGDARLGNMLINEQMQVTAIIDWEMASTGPREMDLAWWIYMLEHHSRGVGAELPTGFRNREAEIKRYEELSGHSVSNFHYFEVLAGVRLSALIARAATLLKQAGYIPADSQMALVNPACTLLAEKLDLPPPTGDSDYYIGNR